MTAGTTNAMTTSDTARSVRNAADTSGWPAPDVPGDGFGAPSGPTVSTTGRSAWRVLGALLAVLSLLWGTFNVISLLAHEESVITTTYVAADVNRLDVVSDNGSVTVVAGSNDAVTVERVISKGLAETKMSDQLVSGVLELRNDCPPLGSFWCAVDYVVTIPPDRAVTVDASDGKVVVRAMSGDLDIDNDNGRIELDDITGDVTVSNDNGRIVGTNLGSSVIRADTDNGRIELSYTEAPDSVTAATSNGRIAVVVPDTDAAYSVDMRTDNGSTTNGVRTDPSSDRTIDLSTANGSITVEPGR